MSGATCQTVLQKHRGLCASAPWGLAGEQGCLLWTGVLRAPAPLGPGQSWQSPGLLCSASAAVVPSSCQLESPFNELCFFAPSLGELGFLSTYYLWLHASVVQGSIMPCVVGSFLSCGLTTGASPGYPKSCRFNSLGLGGLGGELSVQALADAGFFSTSLRRRPWVC